MAIFVDFAAKNGSKTGWQAFFLILRKFFLKFLAEKIWFFKKILWNLLP